MIIERADDEQTEGSLLGGGSGEENGDAGGKSELRNRKTENRIKSNL